LAESGETRFFSTDDNGTLKNYIWLKKTGNIEIGGSSDNMVRYSKLEQAFNQLKSDFNNLVIAYNTHIHPVPNAVPLAPGPVVTTPTVSSGSPSTANILPAKINEIKTS